MKLYKSRKPRKKNIKKTSHKKIISSGRPAKQKCLSNPPKISNILENPMNLYLHDNYPKLPKLIFRCVSHCKDKLNLWVAKEQPFTSLKQDYKITKKYQFNDEKIEKLFNLLTIVLQNTQKSLMLSKKIYKFLYILMKIFCSKYECSLSTKIFKEIEKKFLEKNLLFFKDSLTQKIFIEATIDIFFCWKTVLDME